jgi:hypothetical protein
VLVTVKPDREPPDEGEAMTSEDQAEPKGQPTGEMQAQINREDDPPA